MSTTEKGHTLVPAVSRVTAIEQEARMPELEGFSRLCGMLEAIISHLLLTDLTYIELRLETHNTIFQVAAGMLIVAESALLVINIHTPTKTNIASSAERTLLQCPARFRAPEL